MWAIEAQIYRYQKILPVLSNRRAPYCLTRTSASGTNTGTDVNAGRSGADQRKSKPATPRASFGGLWRLPDRRRADLM